MRTSVLGLTVVAALASSIVTAPMFALAVTDFLTIKKAKIEVDDEEIQAELRTRNSIPTDGSSGAFGYGILTAAGTDAVIVTTTHGGVRDSETQSDRFDPVFHNHFVKLGAVGLCGSNPGVIDITFGSPGDVEIDGKEVNLEDVPSTFTSTHSLTGAKLTLTPGTEAKNAVSFKLDPKFDGAGNLLAVCVTDIVPAQKLKIEAED